ncbi:hypothetical protein Drose_06425 [Dactylosporangium roseum]|uniref:Uncharacterized protein n=1 Tax=Dactylosporangium roseum TaxID=47989 RepID=A0ABY5ZB35_9ACTN|nr:hypothetical protein [Dactylosporangium roseum]UWZ37908.1 hypothetical protein Drose_06425 [Dactylosporangium roseum]
MTAPRFWSDDLDADLLKVVPRAAGVLDQVTAPLWTYGGTTHGRLNHPSVWGSHRGPVAYFGADDSGAWKPDSYWTAQPLVECTWAEVARDAWVHSYVIVVDWVPIWNAWLLGGTFMRLMYDLRGWTPLPAREADRLRGKVLASLIAATEQLREHVGAVA